MIEYICLLVDNKLWVCFICHMKSFKYYRYRIIALFGACASKWVCASTRILAHATVSGDTCPLSSAARNYSIIGAPTDLVTPGKSFPLKETIWSNHQHGNLVSKQNRFNPNDSIVIITVFCKDMLQRDLYAILHIPFMQGETSKCYNVAGDVVGPIRPTYWCLKFERVTCGQKLINIYKIVICVCFTFVIA